MLNSGACEDLDPTSTSIHEASAVGHLPGGRTTPPSSLQTMPDNIFGTGGGGSSSKGNNNGSSYEDNGRLESPSKVLGGSTSWTGGLGHGCTAAVFKNNETTTGQYYYAIFMATLIDLLHYGNPE